MVRELPQAVLYVLCAVALLTLFVPPDLTAQPFDWIEGGIAALGRFDRKAALRTAINVFKRQGPKRADPSEIQTALGLSADEITREFGGTWQLYLEALREESNSNVERFLAAIKGPDGIERAMFDLIDRLEREGAYALGISAIAEFGKTNADVNAVLNEAWRKLGAGLEASRLAGIKTGRIDPAIAQETFLEFMKITLSGLRISAARGATREALRANASHALRSLRPVG